MTTYGEILWRPTAERCQTAWITRFHGAARQVSGRPLPTAADLHAWSVTELAPFWQAVWDFCGVRAATPAVTPWQPPPAGRLRGGSWFPGSALNYAENLLEAALAHHAPDTPVLIAVSEGAAERRWTAPDLKAGVARCAHALKTAGVATGDRVAGVVANGGEALIAMLATASLGAVWASCSPDFGPEAIVGRLGQVRPKVLLFTTAYRYGGKLVDVRPTVAAALAELPSVKAAVGIDHLGGFAPDGTRWEDFLGTGAPPPLVYVPVPFASPLFIMFSSGTTGAPKCIVHGVGGTLLQHKKELLLHSDIGPGSRLLFYTTAGWMMWNWMASALSVGASLVVYDGAVSVPEPDSLWRLVRDLDVTAFGTSPKYLSFCQSQALTPRALWADRPSRLRTILATGSPLLPEHGAYVYREVQADVHLASISGGTDIISCFMLGWPQLPVRAGEIQGPGLGMKVAAFDAAGLPRVGAKGELVCTAPFPSMPLGFVGDDSGERFTNAYFSFFAGGPEVWRHGDYVELTADGGVIVYGRSDATLNPGGVRIGTAEIYRVVEGVPGVLDALAIGRAVRDDTEIVLFIKLRDPAAPLAPIAQEVKAAIRRALTPRHVPNEIVAVRDIPYTRSGKKVEIAVTEAIHGEPVRNLAALANPESMDEFFALGKAWHAAGKVRRAPASGRL